MANAPPSPPPLPAELSIFTATETRAQWLAWLASESSGLTSTAELPPFDASGVDTVDGAGVQLLLALQRTLHERGLTLQLAAPSQTLRNACTALGVGALVLTGAEHD
ncbi:STAS domain-containing protein [Aquabacterium sp.]|uniref:STAS domain-containing protein n=1 Tax=Aquabacterium sp. TaxID=1872578 RepID=UPI002488B19F|nr:STAS domain-containing protein [Aquabacterium sp.]MDI1261419.1 STAS domain-containing protein [Aquabacterium sp.]